MNSIVTKKQTRANALKEKAAKQLAQANALERQANEIMATEIVAKVRVLNCKPENFMQILDFIKEQLDSGKIEISIPTSMFTGHDTATDESADAVVTTDGEDDES